MDNKEIYQLFGKRVSEILKLSRLDMEALYEIRLRIQGPLIVIINGEEFFLTPRGERTKEQSLAYRITTEDIKESMENISGYSLYAYEDELRQGFLNVSGGHRVGIAGKTLLDGNKVRGVKYISYINVRLAHQVKGCASPVMPYVHNGREIYDTLIISPPRCGKTTLLRDLIRQLSNGSQTCPGTTVGVVDERSEIGGCYRGIPQNDLGIRTDVLDCCPKAEGMMMLIRSMSPSVIAVDELGDYGDIHAIESVIHCGCHLVATVHGSSISDIQQKPLMQRLVSNHVFQRYIVLGYGKRAGEVKAIFDQRGTCLYQG